jgi:hypothetical protein
MDPNHPPLDYRSRGDAARDDVGTAGRSVRTWLTLCAVWAVGLVVWAVYLGLIVYTVFGVVG